MRINFFLNFVHLKINFYKHSEGNKRKIFDLSYDVKIEIIIYLNFKF